MTYIPHGALGAANYMQMMARQSSNDKLAFVLTGLSVILVGKMVYDSFTQQHQLREFDRHHDRCHRPDEERRR